MKMRQNAAITGSRCVVGFIDYDSFQSSGVKLVQSIALKQRLVGRNRTSRTANAFQHADPRELHITTHMSACPEA